MMEVDEEEQVFFSSQEGSQPSNALEFIVRA